MFRNSIQSDPAASTTPTGSTRTPLVLPEILGLIFSFLPPGQLVINVSRVCKLWHAVVTAQDPIIRTAYWSETTGYPCQQEEFTRRLLVAQVVHCTFSKAEIYPRRETLGMASARLQRSFAESGVSSVQSLTVECVFEKWFVDRLVVPFGNIRTLRLWHWNPYAAGPVPLDTILEGFRHLRVLEISVKRDNHRPLKPKLKIRFHDHGLPTHVLPKQGTTTDTSKDQGGDGAGMERIFKLESLSLAGLDIASSLAVLHPVLERCPALQDLRIHDLDGYHYHASYPARPHDQRPIQQLIHTAKAACPKIRYIYLSDLELNQTSLPFDRVFEMILLAWPEHVTVGIPARVLYPQLIDWSWKVLWGKVLDLPYLNQVVTLDLLGGEGFRGAGAEERVSRVLHQFLCDAPQLLHLRANACPLWLNLPKKSCDGDEIDGTGIDSAEGRDKALRGKVVKAYKEASRSASWRQVWACRGLKTLHFQAYSGPQKVHAKDEISLSRSCFAYLIKVVPKVQDLWIKQSATHHPFRFDLESGLCLLSGLKDLRTLAIFTPVPAILTADERVSAKTKVEAFMASAPRDLGWIGPKTGITLAMVAQLRMAYLKGRILGGNGSEVVVNEDRPRSSTGVMDGLRSWYYGPGTPEQLEDSSSSVSPALSTPTVHASLSKNTPDEVILAEMKSTSSLAGVADALDELRNSPQLTGCWPSLERLYLSLDSNPPQSSKIMPTIHRLRPELRYSQPHDFDDLH